MRPLVIQCGAEKLPGVHRVDELYLGPFWSTYRKNRPAVLPFPVYVLSAKYGLVRSDQRIASYDAALARTPREPHEVSVEVLLPLLQVQRVLLGFGEVDLVASALYAEALERAGFVVHRLGLPDEGERGGIGYLRRGLREHLERA